MERDNSGRNRKRARDDGKEDKEKMIKLESSHQGKKQEHVDSSSDDKWYEFYGGIGVFDFPWLKEGVVFKTDDYLDDHDNKFSPIWTYDLDAFAASFDHQSCVEEDLCVSPGPDADLCNIKYDDDSFWSLLVDDDLEKVDCIWSCIIDQPLETGFKL